MPLANIVTFKSDILKIFINPPTTELECANAWGDAISNWLNSAVVPPGRTGSELAGVKSTVVSALAGMSAPGTGLIAIPNAFVAGAAMFASSVAAANTPNVVTPPPVPPIFTLGSPVPAEIIADSIALTASTWIITGMVTPPSGTPIPWS